MLRSARKRAWIVGAVVGPSLAVAVLVGLPAAVAGATATSAIVVGVILQRPVRRGPWLLLAIGLALLTPASVLDGHVRTLVFLAGWACVIGATGWFAVLSAPLDLGDVLLDSAVVVGAAAIAGWLLVLDPAFESGTTLDLGAVGPAYLGLVDVLLIGTYSAFDWTVAKRRSTATVLYRAGLLLSLCSHLVWVRSDPVGQPDLVAALLVLACGAWGTAALHPSMTALGMPTAPTRARIASRRFIGLMAAALVPAAALLLIGSASNDRLDAATIGLLSGVLTALVFFRLGLVIRALSALVLAREDLETSVRELRTVDQLTGLATPLLFTDEVDQALRHDPSGVAVFYCDLDDFGQIHENLGSALADAVLVEVGDRLHRLAAPDGVVARMAEDAFALLFRRIENPRQAEHLGRRFVTALADPMDVQGRSVSVTASVGVAGGSSAPDAATIIRRADAAMNRAKRAGKARVALFEETADGSATRMALRADLEGALSGGELHVVYQPIVELGRGRIREAEALLRWTHPTRGSIAPGEFIPVAEASRLIIPIGSWVLREAFRQGYAWARAGREITVSVNVSAVQMEADILGDVRAALAESEIDPSLVVLELTESILVDGDRAAYQLGALRNLGLRLAIDDFGTGYSSLSYLARLPVDQLKIDRSFVRQPDDRQTKVTRNIVRLARSLGIETLGEGVEEPWQRDQLKEMGCQLGQGYLFGRPMPASELTELLVLARGRRPRLASSRSRTAA